MKRKKTIEDHQEAIARNFRRMFVLLVLCLLLFIVFAVYVISRF